MKRITSASVASCEPEPARVAALRRHADLVLGDAVCGLASPADLADVQHRHAAFERMAHGAALPPLGMPEH